MLERGKAHTPARSTQERDFRGLTYGKITPTDIDALIEYHDEKYVLIEAKSGNAQISFGQNLAFERLCDDLQNTKPTLLIYARHNIPTDKPIDFAICIIDKYRYKKEWYYCYKNVKELIDIFLKAAL